MSPRDRFVNLEHVARRNPYSYDLAKLFKIANKYKVCIIQSGPYFFNPATPYNVVDFVVTGNYKVNNIIQRGPYFYVKVSAIARAIVAHNLEMARHAQARVKRSLKHCQPYKSLIAYQAQRGKQ
jgi:hypothetical protein